MEKFIKKAITASAGTGKTYRLSLEYIGLLLKFFPDHLHFSEILVITFTKKATAEIRERIFQHLSDITEQTRDGKKLCHDLSTIIEMDITPSHIDQLRSIYHEMLKNKHKVQINTIDSFIHTVFKTIIAPYLNLTDFKISTNRETELYAEIYGDILRKHKLFDRVKNFFIRSEHKSIDSYETLFKSIIDNRAIFYLIGRTFSPENEKKTSDLRWRRFLDIAGNMLDDFNTYITSNHRDKQAVNLINSEIYSLFFKSDSTADEVCPMMKTKMSDAEFVFRHHKKILKPDRFWNGTTLFRKSAENEQKVRFLEKWHSVRDSLAEFIYYRDFLAEQEEITLLAHHILQKYDEIKFREREFTYNDIVFLTFKYLYDPDLSLIEGYSVSNRFYEYLATAIRFVLIDEFQDTSIIQFRILLPIIMEVTSGLGLKPYGGAIIVGDEKQSIYGWRGGERDLLLNLPSLLGPTRSEELPVSYRSDRRIVDFINEVFSSSVLSDNLSDQLLTWTYRPVICSKETVSGSVQAAWLYHNNRETDQKLSDQEVIRKYIREEFSPYIKSGHIMPHRTAILARRYRDLEIIASVLDELNIDYVLESSNSVFSHRAIKPILSLLRFLVYCDVYDLLVFLRSDIVLIDPHDLKNVAVTYRDLSRDNKLPDRLLAKLSHMPAIAQLLTILRQYDLVRFDSGSETPRSMDLLNFTRAIIENYNIIGLFNLEHDIKNLHFFLKIIAGFENRYSKSLKGFLDFCSDNENSDDYKQKGLEDKEVLQLLTIHKSKGLEFDNVLLYWNLESRDPSTRNDLKYYFSYSRDYQTLERYLLTYNFDHILNHGDFKILKKEKERKETIEKLNTLYVAMTRAKTNLFICFTHSRLKGIDDLLKKKGPTAVDRILSYAIYQNLAGKSALGKTDENYISGSIGSILPATREKRPPVEIDFERIADYIETDHTELLKRDDDRLKIEAYLDFKTIYIKNKNRVRGIVAHHFLSSIRYGFAEERQLAASHTLCAHGHLLTDKEIRELFQTLNRFVDSRPDLFSRKKWSKVFTELVLFTEGGRELRIDRLMVDEKEKEILILDYKSGDIYEEEQMARYVETVKSLPIVDQTGYRIRGEFVELAI